MIDICLWIGEIQDENERVLVQELYQEYSLKITAMAAKILKNQTDAEDALGNVFLKIIKYRDLFTGLDKEERTRLIVIYTRSTCFDMLRKRDKIDVLSLSYTSDEEENDIAGYEIQAEEDVEHVFFREEMINKIQCMIQYFPSPVREIMIMKYFYNMPNTEISGITGVNPSTVGTIIQRNTKKIRRALGEEWE